jgi:hypothetical protein
LTEYLDDDFGLPYKVIGQLFPYPGAGYPTSGDKTEILYTLPWLNCHFLRFSWPDYRGLYLGKYPPPLGGGISADVMWGKKYKKVKRKRGKMLKKKEERGKTKEERGKKRKKGEVKG